MVLMYKAYQQWFLLFLNLGTPFASIINGEVVKNE
jgi:hypothetical protein